MTLSRLVRKTDVENAVKQGSGGSEDFIFGKQSKRDGSLLHNGRNCVL